MRRERLSAKQLVEKLSRAAILKLDICQTGPLSAIRHELLIYRGIAREMGWAEICKKITNALEHDQTKGIFTDP